MKNSAILSPFQIERLKSQANLWTFVGYDTVTVTQNNIGLKVVIHSGRYEGAVFTSDATIHRDGFEEEYILFTDVTGIAEDRRFYLASRPWTFIDLEDDNENYSFVVFRGELPKLDGPKDEHNALGHLNTFINKHRLRITNIVQVDMPSLSYAREYLGYSFRH